MDLKYNVHRITGCNLHLLLTWLNTGKNQLPYGKKFSREEIFAEEIFAEFIFAILPLNREIKFRETRKMSDDRENKFREISNMGWSRK